MKELPLTSFKNFYLGLLTKKTPIIIYQMAKVGSSSVYKSLKNYQINHVFHIHRLNPPVNPLGKRINRFLINQEKKIDIITLLREPISRNISNFFGWINRNNYDFSLEELIELFPYFNHGNSPFTWFEVEFRQVLNINIFDHPFPKDKGWTILNEGNFRILILKIEKGNKIIEEALIDFLNLDQNFKLTQANKTTDKPIGSLFSKFKDNLVLPDWYIDKVYNSKYVKHFYTNSEIEKFKRKY